MAVEFRADTSRMRSDDISSEPYALEPMAPEPEPEPADDELPAPRRWGGVAGAALAIAIAIVLGWLGGALWIVRTALPVLPAVDLVELIAALAAVPALVGIAWLLVRRTSRSEARRFGETAAAMRAEAASLGDSVAAMTATLERSRRQLAEQAATLLAIGDTAHDRIATVGHAMAGEIARADAHAHGLGEAAGAAQASVAALLEALPQARAETDAAAALLDRTALTASGLAAALDAQLAALAERGRSAEQVAGGAAQTLAGHLVRMDATAETASARLEGVTAAMATTVDGLLDRTANAVDDSRKGIAAQGDAMMAMVGAHRAALDGAARESADALQARIWGVEEVVDRLAARLDAQRLAGDEMVGTLEAGVARVEDRLAALHLQGVERSQLLAASISALGGSADAMTEALKAGESMATRTIGTTESLLIALDSAAREIDETLPDALGRLDARVAQSQSVVAAAKPELLALVTAADSTHDAIEAIAGVVREQRETLDRLSAALLETLTEGRTKADALGQMVDETIGRTHRFAEEAAPRLLDALLRVRDTAQVAAERARETLATVIPQAADALGAASTDALRRATSDTVERQIQAVTDATAAAVEASTRATERLAAHVQQIADQTAIVETRLEDARHERAEADRDTLARRVALLIESLNSASIDIARTLAPEVTDSAWAAYLKGDRGVFTRRAVRLLDAGEAREIVRLYDDDAAFREHVNRYIHDFEAMLRGVLAQRDGSPLGVTLLSSDMGKLYVALAQAIERLR